MSLQLPERLELSAFLDDTGPVDSVVGPGALSSWGGRDPMLERRRPLAPPAAASPEDWANPEIGWGVVLADDAAVPVVDRATGADAPEPVRRLLAERPGSAVLRYDEALGTQKLRRYYLDGRTDTPEIGLSLSGTGRGRIPLYLLIVGGPDRVPWKLQQSLNRRHLVGRLPEQVLESYVEALLSGWAGAPADPTQAVVWSTTHDSMTQKMDITVAQQVYAGLSTDAEITEWRLRGDDATNAALTTTLSDHHPALVVTSSHGRTGPLADPAAMRARLGTPVDQSRTPLDVAALLGAWDPHGAIWVSQACCSAGSNLGTSYDGLLTEGSRAHEVVHGVAGLGPQVAPLPLALLGAAQPVRAFVGHVEPTFDWTLTIPETGQHLVTTLVQGIYPGLFRQQPLGLALRAYYNGVGDLYAKLSDARNGIDSDAPGARSWATYYKLTALDRESLVVLGDPTVLVPRLPSQQP